VKNVLPGISALRQGPSEDSVSLVNATDTRTCVTLSLEFVSIVNTTLLEITATSVTLDITEMQLMELLMIVSFVLVHFLSSPTSNCSSNLH